MELRGKVNCYEPVGFGRKEVYVINLSTGVTPFIHFFDKHEHRSLCYRLRKPVLVTVTHAHYRPTKVEFEDLTPEMQDHILNGGLCLAELEKANPLPDDQTDIEWDYDQFQEFCEKIYGKRRPKPEWMTS